MFVVKKLLMVVLVWVFTTQSVQSARRFTTNSSTAYKAHFSLLWIDDNISEYVDDNQQTFLRLRELVPSIEFQSDIDDAILSINRIKYTDKILLIVVSGQKASVLFRYLHYYDLNDDIGALFIFCNNPRVYENLEHAKLIGIFNDPETLIETIRVNMLVLSAEKVKTSVNLLDQKQAWSRIVPADTLTQIWYQLFLDVLKLLPRNEQAKQEMIKRSQEYYVGQSAELLQIDHFRTSYTVEMAIEWYAADFFVHKLVNKALRSENIELLYTFRFFIGDLSAQIKQEYIKQQQLYRTGASKITTSSKSVIKLFSEQKLPQNEVHRLEQSVGTVIAINGFFSTSIYSSEARKFADGGILQFNMQRVLIEISLNTSLQGITAFAEIEQRARFRNEREVVFDCGALFNITFVKYDLFSEIWNIGMVAVPKTSLREHPYLTSVKENLIQNHSISIAYGIIMAHGFEKHEEAIQYFNQLLLTYSSDHIDIPDILQQRGILYEKKGKHALAMVDYNQALEIHRNRVRENLLGMASIHGNMGILQMTNSDFQTSLNSHQEALNIYEQLYITEKNHVTKAKVNVNIGLTYQRDGKLLEALARLTDAQATYERVLPAKHLFAVELLGHIGTIHESTNNLTLAMKFFHQQFNWSKEILPLDHPLLITYLDSVLRIYTKVNQTSDINTLFTEHLQMLNDKLSDNHPLIPRLMIMVASLFESSEPFNAIRLYEQTLQFEQDSKQLNRCSMLISHQNLARLNRKLGNLKEALKHATSALSYQQQISSEKGNRLLEADELHNIGSIYLEIGLFTDALQYLTKSLTIYRSAYATDHPTVQAVLIDITQAANSSRSN